MAGLSNRNRHFTRSTKRSLEKKELSLIYGRKKDIQGHLEPLDNRIMADDILSTPLFGITARPSSLEEGASHIMEDNLDPKFISEFFENDLHWIEDFDHNVLGVYWPEDDDEEDVDNYSYDKAKRDEEEYQLLISPKPQDWPALSTL
ncbi:hypothetical protein H5410_030553 [Solanum commersonii]|uniref:Uncharacterized protein n=1 Tax=Solanum commersonii TaxID=4109 RepID=A0A9J5YH81_SOLCO|nr:hypothetical protein H5410_030553 [Solanum commersonii]